MTRNSCGIVVVVEALVVGSDVTGGVVGGADDVTTIDDDVTTSDAGGVGVMLDGISVTLGETSDVRGDDVIVGTCDVSTGVGEIRDDVSYTLSVDGTTTAVLVTSLNTNDDDMTSELKTDVTVLLLSINMLLLDVTVCDVVDDVIDEGSDTMTLERMVVTVTEGGTVTLTV